MLFFLTALALFVHGPSLVTVSRSYSLRGLGFSLQQLLVLQSTGSVVVVPGLSWLPACRISLDLGLKPFMFPTLTGWLSTIGPPGKPCINFFLNICILLRYSWLTVFQVHSRVIQLYIYTYIIFEIIFHYRLLQNIDYSSLCYIVSFCCLLYIFLN